MKVLMIDSLVGNDYSLALCSGLAAQGVEIRLVVPRGRPLESDVTFPVTRLAPSKSRSISKTNKLLQYVNYFFRLLIIINRSNVQVVHFQFFRRERIDAIFFWALRWLSVPTVYTAHNVLPHENSKIDFFLKYLVYKAADGIIVHSKYVQEKLLNNFRIDASKITIIPHGSYDLYLPEDELSKEEARYHLGFNNEDKVLLFFGYIRAYKGLDLLIDAFEKASANDRRLKLLIAGAPQTQKLAEQYAGQILGSAARKRIFFHSHFIPFKEVALFFTAADLVALPYKTIDHSAIVNLAYSFGKPVIATPVGDFAEVIVQGKSGFIIESSDIDCLAKAIETAFSDIAQLRKMGHFARQLSKKKYSWTTTARRTSSFYETVVGRGNRHIPDFEDVSTS